jgi:hypothetical protein
MSGIVIKLQPALQKKLTDSGLFDTESFKKQKKLVKISVLTLLITIVIFVISKYPAFVPITIALFANTLFYFFLLL